MDFFLEPIDLLVRFLVEQSNFLFFICLIAVSILLFSLASRRHARFVFECRRRALYERLSQLLISGESLEDSLQNIFSDASGELRLEYSEVWVCRNVHDHLRPLESPEKENGLDIACETAMPEGCEHLTLALTFPVRAATSTSPGEMHFVSVRERGRLLAVICARHQSYGDVWGYKERYLEAVAEAVSLILLYSARRSVEKEVRLKSSAMDSSTEGIAVLDSQQQMLYCNHALEQLLGIDSAQHFAGKHWSFFFEESEYSRVSAAYEGVRGHLDQLTIETCLKGGDGSLPVQLTLADLGIDGFVCSVRDISIRKRVEESAEQVALFATLNPSPVFRTDRNGALLMANPAAMSLFTGCASEDEEIHLSLFGELTPSLSLPQLIDGSGVQTVIVDLGDRSFQFAVRGVEHLNAAQFYGTDVTDLKRKGEELLESKAFLRTILDTDPNLIFVKDRMGRFQLCNKAIADAYGTTVEEMVGKTDAYFNDTSEEVKHFRSDDLEVIDELKEKRIPEEEVTDSKGNVRILQTVKRPLINSTTGEVQVLGVATDITERKMLQDRLIHSDKMEAIGRLAGGIAHDFNNILTGILGHTSLLKMVGSESKEVIDAAETIELGANRASELTSKLLGFARKGKHRNIPIDINCVVMEVIDLVSRTFESNLSIVSDLSAESSMILGDPTQIHQILLNLAINSRDSMSNSSKGVLTLQTRNVTSGDLPDALQGVSREFVELCVSDTGCGIEKAVQECIFDPFFTTKKEGEGTGMGLAMVYGIVRNHGGAIVLESEVGRGAAFSVYLPITGAVVVHPENGRERVEGALPISARMNGHSQILLVDDHKVIRDVTSKMLSTLGHTVATASDGVEAVKYYREHNESIDLVILDMVMPNMGAEECFEGIRKINPDARVILSTGYVNNHKVQEILNQGMAGYMQKPYKLDQLSEVVQRALQLD